MKLKQTSFTKMLFTFIALVSFTFIGAVNVEAKTVTVTDEAELRSAIAEKYTEESTIKLGDDITVSEYIKIYLNDKPLTFDLAGHKLEITNGNFVITFGSTDYDTGSFTFTDSSNGSVGQLVVNKYIKVGSENTKSANDTPKTYNFTINGGNYSHKLATSELFELFGNSGYDYGRNITANITIKKGTFTSHNNLLWVPTADKDITMNFKFDSLTYYTSASNKLGYNRFTSIKFEDVVPEDSKIYYLVKTSTTTKEERELTNRTTNVANLSIAGTNDTYIKIVKGEGFDIEDFSLDDLTYGYSSAGTKNISIYNRGQSSLQVKTVASSNANFIVEGTSTPTIDAGATNTDFTIKAKEGLSAGTYTADIIVTDANNKTYTSKVTLKVNPKTLTVGISLPSTWGYGTTHNPTLSGIGELGQDDYVLNYYSEDDTLIGTTQPKLIGKYYAKLSITNSNYSATNARADFEITKNANEIRIVSANGEYVYDGNDHSNNTYLVYYNGGVASLINNKLPNGDIVTATITGNVKDVVDTASGNNTISSVTITSPDGINVTDLYSNINKQAGTLTINPITTPIVVTAGSSDRNYNGEKLTNNTYTYTDGVLLAGDMLSATITGEQLYVGTSNNTVSDVIVKRGDKDITSNYTFGTHINGTLKVESSLQTVNVNDNLNVKVGGTLTIDQIKEQLNCNLTNYNIEFVSGTAGTFDATNGFTAGSNEGKVTMKAVAPAIDANGDGTAEYKETSTSFFINVVNKETVTISGLNNNEEFTYNRSSQKPTGTIVISNENVSLDDLEVRYTGSNGYDSETAPGNAGTYTVTYKVKDSNPNYTGSVSYNFTIKKIQVEKVTLAKNSFEYTGESITPTVNNKNDNLQIYGITTAQDVANYKIYAKLNDTINYEWEDGSNDVLTLNWSIVKATPDYTVPTGLTSIKGKTLNDVSLPDRFTWNDSTTVLTAGTRTYKATYTPVDTDNYKTITDIDIQVVVKDLFNLTTSVDGGNGTITASKTDIVEGSKEEITFTPNAGYMIDKVLVNGVETTVTGNKLELTMNADKEVKVSYKKISYEITVKDTTGVTITPNGTVSVGYGETKEFNILVNTGYKLVKVLVNGEDKTSTLVSNKLTLTNITSNNEIEVIVNKVFDLTTSVDGGNGTVTASKTDIVEGSKVEITFTPDTGYMIDKVLVNSVETTVTGNKLELTMNESKDVKVSYKKIPFTVTVKDVTGATITPNGAVTVNYGDNQEFTITANNGYKLVKVLVDGTDKISDIVDDKLTLTNITSNINLEVVVEKIVYEVIEGANQKYVITENDKAVFKVNADLRLFSEVYVDDVLVDSANYNLESGSTIITLKKEYVDTLSEGEHTLRAVFNDGGEATTQFTVAKVNTPVEDDTKTEDNPKTGDNVIFYVVTGTLSMLGLAGAGIYTYRRKQEN